MEVSSHTTKTELLHFCSAKTKRFELQNNKQVCSSLMGKSKKAGNSSNSKGGKGGKAAAASKCTCDHPYNCACGNRPPRPSRGHKWDPTTQEWGGKGHKQKGASGQTSSVGQESKVTAVGQTKIAQWQQLPSTILKQYCQKQKRAPPKFKDIHNNNKNKRNNNSNMGEEKNGKVFKYRCIVPDPKDPDKDLFFVPAQPVENEEQSREEAALLALIELTPNLPHERKLPEPYKTTWLTTIQALKESDKKMKKTTKDSNDNKSGPSTNDANTTTSRTDGDKKKKPDTNYQKNGGAKNTNGGARSNTSLMLGSRLLSTADKRREKEEKRQKRNAKLRKLEAIRMANRDHPVFLSAKLRGQIQKILRGEDVVVLEEDDPAIDDDDEDITTPISDQQAYVEDRLHHEGFTKFQARKAYSQTATKAGSNDDDDDEAQYDRRYEDCLQWLCIHLDEDQLPEGINAKESTLDVVVMKNSNGDKKNSSDVSKSKDTGINDCIVISTEAKQVACKYGLSDKDAAWLLDQKDDKSTVEDMLWQNICKLANTGSGSSHDSTMTVTENRQVYEEEMEALDAIFPSDCHVKAENGKDGEKIDIITIHTPEQFTLEVIVSSNSYPSSLPQRVFISSEEWPDRIGVVLHVEILKFLSSIQLGEPMIFEIYGQLQELLQSTDELEVLSLNQAGQSVAVEKSTTTGSTSDMKNNKNTTVDKNKQRVDEPKSKSKRRPVNSKKRPSERSFFWSVPTKKTPPATAFPKISKSLEDCRKSLPAAKARQDFLSAMKEADNGSRVVLVTGDTGCGKTTQIPQFILEEAPEDSKIVVAQPRRLAATGVAARVADERGESPVGRGSVGYVVRGASELCKNTRLLFCTTGVLLRQLQCDKALDCITHIVVDEVHERNLDGDVLMGLLKQLLVTVPHLRVVLMSATLDADRFASYWGNNTPRMHIPGRTFPVTDFLLEDVLSMTGYIPPKKLKKKKYGFGNQQYARKQSPWNDSELSDEDEPEKDEGENENSIKSATDTTSPTHDFPIEDLVERMDETRTDYDLLGLLVRHLVRQKTMGDDGSILVFLSGAPEINQAKNVISRITRGMPILLLPLHGGLQPREQNIVFQPTRGNVKVILSTNVAETSITIPDCTVVIDCCREKQSSYDPSTRMPLLLEQFASQASLKQRRGRAGRVRKGNCYKLISQKTYSKLREHSAPEITRCALDQTLLSLLFLGVETGSGSFLRTLLDPPSEKSVDAAIFSLRKLGALESEAQTGELRLTPLGMHLAGIPAPPVVGKMLVMGSILGCRRAALAMAAGISVGRSPFLRIDNPKMKGKNAKDVDESAAIQEMKQSRILEERANLFKEVGNSDHAMLARAFLNWENLKMGGGERKRYCEKLGLAINGMRDILQLVNQLDSSLRGAGYGASEESDRNAKSCRILHACAVSAMAPGQLVKVVRPSVKYIGTAEGALEKEGRAKELKLFIRPEDSASSVNGDGPLSVSTGGNVNEERVFIHPSSSNFSVGNYSCPWLVYHSLVRTSKSFLRDATECSAYSLLLFGGPLDVQARNDTIVIDGWVKLSANARIGALIRGLRDRMDELLAKKIEDPFIDISCTSEMKLIVKLLLTDGSGN